MDAVHQTRGAILTVLSLIKVGKEFKTRTIIDRRIQCQGPIRLHSNKHKMLEED